MNHTVVVLQRGKAVRVLVYISCLSQQLVRSHLRLSKRVDVVWVYLIYSHRRLIPCLLSRSPWNRWWRLIHNNPVSTPC